MDIVKRGLALSLFRKDNMSLIEEMKEVYIGLLETHVDSKSFSDWGSFMVGICPILQSQGITFNE